MMNGLWFRVQGSWLIMVQEKMVKESLGRAFDELHAGKVHHDARKLFSK